MARKTTNRARKQKVTKMDLLRDIFRKNPDADPVKAAERLKTAPTQAYKARRDVRVETGYQFCEVETPGSSNGESDDLGSLKRDIRTLKKIGLSRVRELMSIVEAATE